MTKSLAFGLIIGHVMDLLLKYLVFMLFMIQGWKQKQRSMKLLMMAYEDGWLLTLWSS